MDNIIQIHTKYYPLLNNTRYFIVTGGRGSAKSYSVNTFLLMLLNESKSHKVLFLRKTLTSAYISIIPEFLDKIERLGLTDVFDITKSEIIHKHNGNSILFRGIQTGSKDNTANLKSIQGITTMVLDEAEELTDEDVFDRIDLSIRQQGVQNRVILVMNPTTHEHWVYKRFFEGMNVNGGSNLTKDNVTYIHTTYLDNIKNLDVSFIEQVNRIKETNPNKYNHTILGGWIEQADGAIFTNWIEGEFNTKLPYCYGADFGFKIDPDTLVKVAVDNLRGIIYLHECYYDRKQLSTDELGQMYLSRIDKKTDLIVADNAEPRLINDLKRKGLNIRESVKGQGSVTAGITRMLNYQLVVTPESVNIKKELKNYVWNDKKAGIPIDDYNHTIDCIRYALNVLINKKLNANEIGGLI